jgi:hypothetical protein
MQECRRCGSVAAAEASASSQPEAEAPTTPAEARRSQSRRDSAGALSPRDV